MGDLITIMRIEGNVKWIIIYIIPSCHKKKKKKKKEFNANA
jgi:hypothetical protein